MATCPSCKSAVFYVTLQATSVKTSGDSWKGVMYLCPSCGSVLSAAIDPIALKADIVQELVETLRRG
jgi:transposase-like protein